MNGFSGFGNSPAKQKTIDGITYPKATKKTTTKKKMSSDYVRPIGPRDEDGGFTTIVNENASGPGSEVKTTVYDGGHSGYRPAPKSPAKQGEQQSSGSEKIQKQQTSKAGQLLRQKQIDAVDAKIETLEEQIFNEEITQEQYDEAMKPLRIKEKQVKKPL